MPVTYQLDAPQRIVRITYADPVSAADWTDTLEAVLADPLYTREFNFIADRRGARAPDTAFARRIAEFLQLHRSAFGKRMRVAILAEDPTGLAMARMQQIFNEAANVESRIFGDEPSALAWVTTVAPAASETA